MLMNLFNKTPNADSDVHQIRENSLLVLIKTNWKMHSVFAKKNCFKN